MIYFWSFLGWLWSQRRFFLVALVSAVVFFTWFFPFSDLSDLMTSVVARATNSQVYLQFESMDLHLIPTPAVSAKQVSIETPTLPALEAKWIKISPSWLNLLFNAWTIKKASSGDPEASAKLGTRIGLNFAAEGILGADVNIKIRPGANSEQGLERSKVSLFVENLDLSAAQKWYDLPAKISGQATLESTVQFVPGFGDQPEGNLELNISKFNMPASTLMVPYEGAMLPVNLPTLTLQNVVLRGHMAGGKLMIEEGTFGQKNDPISGRIKGQLSLRLANFNGQVQPQWGPYSLNVELNTSKAVEKEIGFAFLIFDSAKSPTSSGSHYLFQASGASFGPPPQISRINSF